MSKSHGWMHGNNDLFYKEGYVYRDDHGRLVCAWDTVRLDDKGQQIGEKTGCRSVPGGECSHLVSSSVYNIHHLFMATRIALSYLKLEGGDWRFGITINRIVFGICGIMIIWERVTVVRRA
jgi:hypothetical protein